MNKFNTEMKYTILLMSFLFMSCNSQPKNNIFTSEFGYSIILPEKWAEYEDEENLNAFFDTENWTGNLRITVIELDRNIDDNYIEKEYIRLTNAEKIITQNGYTGFKYLEKSQDGLMYYWQLFHKNKMFVCSFVLNLENNTKLKEAEIEKVEKIINSIKAFNKTKP
ncbi:DUF3805 domain-containing protein [Flavobacterium sp. TP390]|uniref:DUF3805 domain-containing protein n=2 Tax=Flavobacterium profundi TaxID=1774945 RepID=A0A6I4IT02_9FLAO|nr:DUF3805 domain-containing protein [Flavobacterium profundi]